MSISTPIDWATHVSNLKEWNKSITQYAKMHSLSVQKLYYHRTLLSTPQSNPQIKRKIKQKTQFIPIRIAPSLTKTFSIKIHKDNLTFDLTGLSMAAIKELLHSSRGD